MAQELECVDAYDIISNSSIAQFASVMFPITLTKGDIISHTANRVWKDNADCFTVIGIKHFGKGRVALLIKKVV